jgi:hypothetical protein
MAQVREELRTHEEERDENTEMARVIVAQKQEENERYRFRQKMVRLDDVQDELEAMRN